MGLINRLHGAKHLWSYLYVTKFTENWSQQYMYPGQWVKSFYQITYPMSCNYLGTVYHSFQRDVWIWFISLIYSFCSVCLKFCISNYYLLFVGLSELGPEVTKVFVLPKLRALSDKIEQCMEGMNAYDKNAASHIKGLLLVSVEYILSFNVFRESGSFFFTSHFKVKLYVGYMVVQLVISGVCIVV